MDIFMDILGQGVAELTRDWRSKMSRGPITTQKWKRRIGLPQAPPTMNFSLSYRKGDPTLAIAFVI
eukprot:gene32143-41675_t